MTRLFGSGLATFWVHAGHLLDKTDLPVRESAERTRQSLGMGGNERASGV